MITQPVHGLLFFWGEVRTCVGYDVSSACARLHSAGLRLLPTDFYVTFDEFLTVRICRLAWRWQDDVGVIFEGWVDDPFELYGPIASDYRDVVETLKVWRVLHGGISVQ